MFGTLFNSTLERVTRRSANNDCPRGPVGRCFTFYSPEEIDPRRHVEIRFRGEVRYGLSRHQADAYVESFTRRYGHLGVTYERFKDAIVVSRPEHL